MKTILDTDIFSEIIKGKDAIVSQRAGRYLASQRHLTISSITVFEVVFGLLRKMRTVERTELIKYLSKHEVMALDQEAANLAGEIRAKLTECGRIIGEPDVLIGATALCHKLVLVTGNQKHFEFIREAGYPLELDNWRVAVPV